MPALTVVVFVVHFAVAALAITRPDRTPASRVAWVAVIMALPIVGIVAYLLLGQTDIGKGRVKRLRAANAALTMPPATAVRVDSGAASQLFELGHHINGFPAVGGNSITLLGDPSAPPDQPTTNCDAAMDALIHEIEQATQSVHISFYIWLNDHNGGRAADAVAAAAQRGVTCRVMVDALGSRAFIKSPRWRQLKDAGVHTVATLDDIPRLGHLAIGRLDLRNHRKIAVIDNRVSFCGSQNCADPAFLVAKKYAPWIDILFRCEGPIVRQEQQLFLAGWLAETGETPESLGSALPDAPGADHAPGTVVAQMFGTGPTTHDNAMSDMFVAAIYAADQELVITTPYFVPDEALLRAICAAPRRGVTTKLVVPARNNSALVGATCRSTYPDLLAAGVEIFEYPLGLLHTKSITIDGQLALVGSANMDRRSLQLNFENNLVIADAELTAQIRARQESYLAVSQQIARDDVRGWSWTNRLVQNAIGMLSPVL